MPRPFAFALPFLFAATLAHAGDARVFFLKDDGGRFSIEAVTVPAGQTEVITCGRGHEYVDVLFPPAVGRSASLAQASPERRVVIMNATGTPRVIVKAGDRQFEMPALDQPGGADCRVSVVAADGRRQAFVLRGFEHAAEDTVGPVLDLFAGQVPMQPGDAVITTETWRRATGAAARGEVPLVFDRYLFAPATSPVGAAAHAVVDLAAGSTVVTRAMVPSGVAITPSQMTRVTSGVTQSVPLRTGGATGDVAGVAGEAVLPELRLGGLVIRDAAVLVLDSLPRLAGREVAAIVGLDLLRRAPAVTLEYPAAGRREGRLVLGEAAVSAAGMRELPFAVVNSHLAVRAGIGSARAAMILDSGAPVSVLDRACAEAAGLAIASSDRRVRGLDGAGLEVATTTIPALALGGHVLRGWASDVAALPVFGSMRVHGQPVGLLGNDVLARLGRLEIDFERGVVSVPAPR